MRPGSSTMHLPAQFDALFDRANERQFTAESAQRLLQDIDPEWVDTERSDPEGRRKRVSPRRRRRE